VTKEPLTEGLCGIDTLQSLRHALGRDTACGRSGRGSGCPLTQPFTTATAPGLPFTQGRLSSKTRLPGGRRVGLVGLDLNLTGQVLLKDHLFLQIGHGALAGSLGLLIHGVGQGNIGVGQANSVEIPSSTSMAAVTRRSRRVST